MNSKRICETGNDNVVRCVTNEIPGYTTCVEFRNSAADRRITES